MPKRSQKEVIADRVAELKETVNIDAEQLRRKTLRKLEKIFNIASALASGQIKTQTENGKTRKVTVEEKKRWLLVAKKAAFTIKTVSNNFNENKIKDDLKDLEQLVKQAKTLKPVKDQHRLKNLEMLPINGTKDVRKERNLTTSASRFFRDFPCIFHSF